MISNEHKADIEYGIREIALEYAKRDLGLMIEQGRVSIDETTGCLNCMFDTYVSAVQYLSNRANSLPETES